MSFCQKLFLLLLFMFSGALVQASHECNLSGILVRKYFPAPEIVKNPCFGWFVELEDSSKEKILEVFRNLSERDQKLYSDYINGNVQLILPYIGQPEQCRELENRQVFVQGRLWNPPHICRPIPSYQLELTKMEAIASAPVGKNIAEEDSEFFFIEGNGKVRVDEREFDLPPTWGQKYVDDRPYSSEVLELSEGEPEILVKLKGRLHMMLFPGPPEYSSIERGDVPEYSWFVTLDEKSFQVAANTPVAPYGNSMEYMMESTNWFKVQLCCLENLREDLHKNVGKEILVTGYLFHAMTGHHHAPFLMDVHSIDSERLDLQAATLKEGL